MIITAFPNLATAGVANTELKLALVAIVPGLTVLMMKLSVDQSRMGASLRLGHG